MKTCKVYFTLIVLLLLVSCNETTDSRSLPVNELTSNLVSCDQTIEDELLASCGLTSSDQQVEIWTWNLRFFPQDATTASTVVSVLDYYQPAVVALQEIKNRLVFEELLEAMPLYEGWVVNLSGDLDVAYLYNTCLVSSMSDPSIILEDIWPRPPVLWSANLNGNSVDLINIHLKCCNDGVEDRQLAAETIRDYMMEREEDPLILLGDFNDEIDDEGIRVFLEDSSSFRYADQHISFGPEENFSYPSWPSDIDHILINKPLFSKLDTASTLLLEKCIPSYSRSISDHRVVAAIFDF